MKVLLTGGGTGGHITPILAVAHELKQQQPDCVTVYVGERHGNFSQLTADSKVIDNQYTVFAGKFRRYHGEHWLRRVIDVKTNLKNLRDTLYVVFGFFQSLQLLGKVKPDVVFLKGGYVGVPIGLAAATRHIPIVTHDSDALPGLANRLISRWARVHATALPADYYTYPSQKVQAVGVLVEPNYQPVDAQQQRAFKEQLTLPVDAPLLLITGGSSGAERINKAIVSLVGELLQKQPRLQIVHQVGKGKAEVYEGYHHERLQTLEFLSPMYVYMGAADLIVTRASANTIAELGVQGKACIVVPNPDLTGGHQTKNAERLEGQGSAIVVKEDQLYDLQHGLFARIEMLLSDENKRKELGSKLQQFTIPDAAHKLAVLLLGQADKKSSM
jgi:UDP-N-acetylglucosamine--N-acetylmuramyl-(pentapeptide) pyrophosphoryl-undecaprenol N-acetylglucosamine transferase